MRRAIVLVLLVSGCATIPPASVMDADEAMVASCRYLGEVAGTSAWGGVVASYGMKSAQNSGRTQAARMGATHVVWRTVTAGASPSASGRAYNCR